MDSAVEPPAPNPARHARAVFGAAALIAIGIATGTEAARSALTLAAGAVATSAVLHYAWKRRVRARRGLGHSGGKAPGRIVLRRDPGRAVFELPAEGVEPWLADACALALGCIGGVFVARAIVGGEVVVFGLVVTLLIGVGLRLRAAASDRLRIEVGIDDWMVESTEGGRPARRSGRGALLPELSSESLLLWSSLGRVAVLRGELETEERAWLADELTRLVRIPASVPAAEHHDGVDDGEPDGER